MSFAVDYLAQLEAIAARTNLPRVKALHLPPENKAGRRDGEFCALELDDGSLGLSYVLLKDTLDQLLATEHGSLLNAPVLDVARGFRDASGTRKTVGFAAANALTRCFLNRTGFVPEFDVDSLGQIAPVAGDHVGMIGFFPPLIRKVTAAGAALTVIELNPELAGDYPGYTVSLDAGDLRNCNKVLSTSTVLLNNTLDQMLSFCTKAEVFALVGPSAGCLPDALFARGVTLLGGSWVSDSQGFINAIATGEAWSAYARKCAVRPSSYPGFDVLLNRLESY